NDRDHRERQAQNDREGAHVRIAPRQGWDGAAASSRTSASRCIGTAPRTRKPGSLSTGLISTIWVISGAYLQSNLCANAPINKEAAPPACEFALAAGSRSTRPGVSHSEKYPRGLSPFRGNHLPRPGLLRREERPETNTSKSNSNGHLRP